MHKIQSVVARCATSYGMGRVPALRGAGLGGARHTDQPQCQRSRINQNLGVVRGFWTSIAVNADAAAGGAKGGDEKARRRAEKVAAGLAAARDAAARGGMEQFEYGAAHLVSIHASHYCEKVRWALELCDVPFEEEPHIPAFIYGATNRQSRGKGRSVPVVRLPDTPHGQGIALVQSSEVLEFCGALPQGAWLYPSGFADEVRDRVAWYDAKLGPHTRRWGYHQILPNRHLGFELMSVGVGGMERQLGRLAYPLIVRFIRKGLNITPQKAEESLRRVEAVFDEVADVSEDGYIVGGSFTAADLTFASLASMALLPPEHPSGLPQPEDGSLAADVASEIQRLRATHGGRHALRMYREHRHTRPGGV